MRFQFIADHREEFPVVRMCKGLSVSPSGFYAWRTRPPSVREMANQELYKKIETVYNDNREVYGSPRIYHELRSQGEACSENRIARLMRLRRLSEVDGSVAYRGIVSLATRLGHGPHPAQTEYEYAGTLSDTIPSVRDDIYLVAGARVERVYAQRPVEGELRRSLRRAYARVRTALLRLALRWRR